MSVILEEAESAAMEWYFQPPSQSFLVAVDELKCVAIRFDY